MSSNVGLSTPRGSGTSGYVQRNWAFMKPRNAGYGAPYPPISSSSNGNGGDMGRPFKQRQPDKQILEHDRRRAVEVKVMEERERLEEENERIEEELGDSSQNNNNKKKKRSQREEEAGEEEKEEGEEEEEEQQKSGRRVLTEEEIDERCEALRERLLKELEEEDKEEELRRNNTSGGDRGDDRDFGRRRWGGGGGGGKFGRGMVPPPPKERRQFKSYQVHELAEAKIEESERFKKALGIREDKDTGEISSSRGEYNGRRREREGLGKER